MLEKKKADETLGNIISPRAKAALGMIAAGTLNKPNVTTSMTTPKPHGAA